MKALYLSLAIVVVDQVTKLLVKGFAIPFLGLNYEGMYLGQMIPVWGDFFRLTFVENPGMAFGYDPGDSFKMIISIFSLVASIGLVIYLYAIRDKSLSLRIAIACILGGAVGNLIDRTFYGVFFDYAPLFYGKVVDFFDFDFFNFTLFGRSYDRWPVFNIADAAVTIGVLILILFYKKNGEKIEANENTVELSGTSETVVSEKITEVRSDNPEKRKEDQINEQTDKPKEISD
ncbi:MAG TPA: signal peptidase II [Ignavibacteriaceae bacterium]|mgnify:CR=1 FL=1|nr:MAG: Lipoprotein signal peptidase [Ignavibacteria bacterium ADurb.Bin266]OQY73877.1 MAG: signal peptidase II [Ignavibacteriales bacterium UTCHB2]HQF41969.1 signal peptidase II [Ignavibacteriaceae bacterium]HQI41023.1 signal peptidase II [Ignavibacteriaceae bacterium]HQJ45392.1 signal peptidase II [Ignavibacteriaceae bacterium]